jgi:hypothetical protein
MSDIEFYQNNMTLLLEQRAKILTLSPEKQRRHLPRIDSWISEVGEALDNEVKDMVG